MSHIESRATEGLYRQNEYAPPDMPPFGLTPADHLQYHAFCGDFFVSLVMGRTSATDYQWVWIYDGEDTIEAVKSQEPIEIVSDNDGVDIATSSMRMRVPEHTRSGLLEVETTRLDLRFEYKEVDRFGRGDNQLHRAIYLPNPLVEINYNGESRSGRGYLKRWCMDLGLIRHSAGRVATGHTDDRRFWWATDGHFDEDSQDYFRVVDGEGEYQKFIDRDVSIKRDGVYVYAPGNLINISMHEVARSSILITAERTEWRWLQRYLVADYEQSGATVSGKAQDEYWHALWV